MPKKATSAKRQALQVKASRQDLHDLQDKLHPEHPVHPVKKTKPLYRRPPPKPKGRAGSPSQPRRDAEIAPYHPIAPSHFTLREDGQIQVGSSRRDDRPERTAGPCVAKAMQDRPAVPTLVYQSDTPFIRLYHGNCLELLDAIAAKYPEGRFDAIFADPPYFLSNGGITCHAGKMVKVDKGDWDVSRGPELNHEFNTEWLRRCQRTLKPNGTIWVTGTHHVIFSIGYAMQQLGYKILNDIAWEKPNPPPNLSCRYFTHSTETVLWAAKNEKSKHVFNYQEMRKVTGKQMKTVWRKEEFLTRISANEHELKKAASESEKEIGDETLINANLAQIKNPENPSESGSEEKKEISDNSRQFASNEFSPIWTLSAPGSDEKTHGKHPTQKPVALVERCLLASTNEGDLVLDPFLGNGTTAVASLWLKRGCVGVELDLHHVEIAARRADREIIEIWLRNFRVRVEISVVRRGELHESQTDLFHSHSPRPQTPDPSPKIPLDLFPDSINGSRDMTDVPEIPTERIFHECKFVFLACRAEAPACGAKAGLVPITSSTGAVVHTTVDISLQEA